MSRFKNREEYEKWKEQRLEEIKSRDDNTAGHGEKDKHQDSIDSASSGSFTNAIGKIIIGLLIFLAGILFYSLLSKDHKANDSVIPNKQGDISAVVKSPDAVDIQASKEPASLTLPAAPKSWADIVQRAKKSVVSIKTANSMGSGFIISPDGIIITNSHVIHGLSDVEVIFNSNVSQKASIIKRGTMPLDITVLKIAGNNLDHLALTDSDCCKEGEEVVAIGSPYSLSGTVTKGIISNCNRQLKDEFKDITYIQTDTPISPGNSGGPLINKNGEVIGMLTWKIVRKGFEGLNFAIASNVINKFKNGLLDKLEESAKKNYEEKNKEFNTNIERLKLIWMNEYTSYYNKVGVMVAKGALSVDQGTQLLSRATAPPAGFSSVPEWLASLADSVLKGEITENQAHVLIRNSFSL